MFPTITPKCSFNPLDAGALLQTVLPVEGDQAASQSFNPLDAGALLQTEILEDGTISVDRFQSPRCRGASSDSTPATASVTAAGVSIPSMPGRFFRPYRPCREARVPPRFNPLDAGALLQTTFSIAHNYSLGIRFNPLDAGALLQTVSQPGGALAGLTVSIPSMPGRFFRLRFLHDGNTPHYRFQSPRCRGASSDLAGQNTARQQEMEVSIPSMPGRFFRLLARYDHLVRETGSEGLPSRKEIKRRIAVCQSNPCGEFRTVGCGQRWGSTCKVTDRWFERLTTDTCPFWSQPSAAFNNASAFPASPHLSDLSTTEKRDKNHGDA